MTDRQDMTDRQSGSSAGRPTAHRRTTCRVRPGTALRVPGRSAAQRPACARPMPMPMPLQTRVRARRGAQDVGIHRIIIADPVARHGVNGTNARARCRDLAIRNDLLTGSQRGTAPTRPPHQRREAHEFPSHAPRCGPRCFGTTSRDLSPRTSPPETTKGKELPPHPSQRIAHRGPCGKAPVMPQNRRPKPQAAEMRALTCVCCRRTGDATA
jgi:hypothetical protein